jgi:small GTP-binding protein
MNTQKSKLNRALTKDLLDIFRQQKISEDTVSSIEAKLAELGSFVPTVGIFGKTGAGKSSLCNALFGQETAKVSDVSACTREPQEIFVKLTDTGNGINLIDLPGVGESKDRDDEYKKLYEAWIPKLDLLIWVIRADDRTFSVDEFFYENVVKSQLSQSKIPFLVVINQADKVNPLREWDAVNNRPGFNQQEIISERIYWASEKFDTPWHHIVAVSAFEKYNLGKLVETIIEIVPNDKKLGFLGNIKEEVITTASRELTLKSVIEYIKNTIEEVKPYIPEIIAGIKWLTTLFKG